MLFHLTDVMAPGLAVNVSPISNMLLAADVIVISSELLSEVVAPLPPMSVLVVTNATVILINPIKISDVG
jgi:hypothetical protein